MIKLVGWFYALLSRFFVCTIPVIVNIYNRVRRVILSCQTKEQLQVAHNYTKLFLNGISFRELNSYFIPELNNLFKFQLEWILHGTQTSPNNKKREKGS